MHKNNEKPIWVTHGFRDKFFELSQDPDVGYGEIAKLLILQPYLVAHLLNVANARSERRPFARPKSVKGIINILGFDTVINESLSTPMTLSGGDNQLRIQVIDAHGFAVVLSELAERTLGRFYAPDFFLIGLIAAPVAEGVVILEDCHEDIVRHFNGSLPVGHPTITEGAQLIGDFKKNRTGDHPEIYTAWAKSIKHAHEALKGLNP